MKRKSRRNCIEYRKVICYNVYSEKRDNMYIQNINGIKAVAIMLDGCILDLNKYRYNYYKNICQEHNITISKQEFYDNLNSQYTMYNSLPLSDKYKSSHLNQKIEDELYAYLKYKGVYPKEGLFELLEYFKQKDIQVAVMSTHRTKKAVEYLQLTRVFSHVHFVVGSDTKYKPLPSCEMLSAIGNQFGIKPDELLVISPFLSLNMTANEFGSPVIYYKDLVEPTAMEKASSIKIVNTFFEILNFLLLERAYDSNIYSSMLGMSNKMNKEELDKVNEHLKEVYHDDQQILDIVQDTYEYHLSQLNENYPKKEVEKETIKEEKEEIFVEEIKQEVVEEEKIEEISELVDEKDEIKPVLSLNKQEELELTSAWNQLMINETNDIYEEFDDEDDEDELSPTFTDYLVYIFSELIYSLTISFIVLIVGVIVVLIGKEFFMSISPIITLFNGYLSLVDLFVAFIFNGLHTVINFVPNYYDYLLGTHFLSSDGLQLLHILLFNSFVIFIVKMIILIIKKEKALYEDDD